MLEGFLCFFLCFKANSKVLTHKEGARPTRPKSDSEVYVLYALLYVFMLMFKCINYLFLLFYVYVFLFLCM
jgi:hypothetical protein